MDFLSKIFFVVLFILFLIITIIAIPIIFSLVILIFISFIYCAGIVAIYWKNVLLIIFFMFIINILIRIKNKYRQKGFIIWIKNFCFYYTYNNNIYYIVHNVIKWNIYGILFWFIKNFKLETSFRDMFYNYFYKLIFKKKLKIED